MRAVGPVLALIVVVALLASSTLLLIPWIGYAFVAEMERFLAHAQARMLAENARAVATLVQERSHVTHRTAQPSRDLAPNLPQPVNLDGRIEDWTSQGAQIRGIAQAHTLGSSVGALVVSGSRRNRTELVRPVIERFGLGPEHKVIEIASNDGYLLRWFKERGIPVLGVEPVLGRTFTASEDLPDAEGVAVLSHALWQRRFGGSPTVLGRRITLGGVPRTVVGVMPPGFALPADLASREAAQVFVPLALDPAQRAERGSHFLAGIGRLAPGAGVERASREAAALAASFVSEYPDEYPAGMRFDSFVLPLDEDLLGTVRRPLLLLSGAVALLLLAAATNVLALMLARAEDRRRELAVRTALGAGRGGLARLALAESLLLSLAGGAAGLLLALWAVEALPALYPAALPRSSEIALDPPVVAFTAALSLLLGLAFALLPTLRLGRWADSLRQGGRSSGSLRQQRVRGALVVAQVALALVLLAGAGLLTAGSPARLALTVNTSVR
mgnify:CR=1 FL=1